MDASTLTYQEIKYALALLIFIKEKRNGDIKAINVAVGTEHRTYNGYDKRNGSSPTLNTDSVFITGVIDMHDHSSVTMLDNENAFLHAENDEYVLMLLCVKIA